MSKINEHFVPKTYMRGWTKDGNSVYELNLKTREISRVNIDRINCYIDLYETPEIEDSKLHIEKDFSKYENEFRKLLDRVENSQIKLTDSGKISKSEKEELARAIAVMFCRNLDIMPFITDIIGGVKSNYNQQTIAESIHDNAERANMTKKERDDFSKYVLSYCSITPDSVNIDSLTSTITQCNCALLYSEHRDFMFSNLPVYISKEESKFYMPLSPKWAVLFSKEFDDGTIQSVNADMYNCMLNANLFCKYIYASELDDFNNFNTLDANLLNIL